MKAYAVLLAVLIGAAAHAAPDEGVRARVVEILGEFNRISDIDIGNCDHEQPEFHDAYQALQDSPDAVAMHRVLEHYQLSPEATADVDRNPSKERCIAALTKARALFATHGEYIQKLAASLPARAD